ncbi:2OG-Fe dioxygenase family protein [Agrobacterium tumefaciens]|uniref:2OG-Fe dioxygenase family protein n=1 Tax=Agrobacterium tumefaciens TaxID=358 RepID=A0A4D7Z0D0_AGRTU|nr:2OG-Fe dioxygenase family protein [Agrobacterium tumefaciens]QCL95760.1 hypothetical protein CFBP7129_15860 [Agrobacterium tumefaciens]
MNTYDPNLAMFSKKPTFVYVNGNTFDHDARETSASRDHIEIQNEFDQVEIDKYMKNGETYRLRRLTKYVADTKTRSFEALENQIFFQGYDLNSYGSGIKREYPQLSPSLVNNQVLQRLSFACLDAIQPLHKETKWTVGVHFIRTVCTTDEMAKPSPDGAHQDGHDYLSISLIKRENIEGGATNILDINKNVVSDFLLENYLQTVLVNDKTMYHDALPIRRVDPNKNGIRDVIIIDYDIREDQQNG